MHEPTHIRSWTGVASSVSRVRDASPLLGSSSPVEPKDDHDEAHQQRDEVTGNPPAVSPIQIAALGDTGPVELPAHSPRTRLRSLAASTSSWLTRRSARTSSSSALKIAAVPPRPSSLPWCCTSAREDAFPIRTCPVRPARTFTFRDDRPRRDHGSERAGVMNGDTIGTTTITDRNVRVRESFERCA